MDEQSKARDMIRQAYEDGWVEIGGRRYEFLRMTHLERRKVFAFVSTISDELERGSYGWMNRPEWDGVEKLLWSRIAHDGRVLSQEPEYWETYPQDYLLLVQTALMVVSYPFFPDSGTPSTAAPQQSGTTRSRKPM